MYNDDFFDSHSAGSLRSARLVLAELFRVEMPQSVLDVGCGLGTWLSAARELGVRRVIGVDGDYVTREKLLIEPDCFRSCNLDANQVHLRVDDPTTFDLVMSLEVAEHLPASRADSFIADLCAFSDLVLFSAAVPLQGGTNHVNEQWPEYWSNLFRRNSFMCFDILRSRIWNVSDIEWWYRQNVLLFARAETPTCRRIESKHRATPIAPALVHPDNPQRVFTGGSALRLKLLIEHQLA